MNKNKSVEMVSSPEFIDVRPFNPLISQCTIKVLYVGQNRNMSYISKEVATKMADSLPGSPIVGAFREDVEDFGDHGEVMTVEDGEIKFSCKTRPYGFVAPDAKVWFQKFTDTDEFGNETEREYLMTEGYLWTGQYAEAQAVLDGGKGQSMELDSDTLEGHWSTDSSNGCDFFIINDAIFSKLCILGDDVEPCFEGASVLPKQAEYTAGDPATEFKATLFTMMQELRSALTSNDPAEGGLDMSKTKYEAEEAAVEEATETVDEQPVEETPAMTEEPAVEQPVEEQPAVDEAPATEEPQPEEEFSLTQMVGEIEALRNENAALLAELNSLKEFKLKVENEEKDALIAKYFMLSDEDKADVIENKVNYTLDEIESKLALAYVRKNVDFNVEDAEERQDEEPALTFSLDDEAIDTSTVSTDPLIEALRDYRRENSIY